MAQNRTIHFRTKNVTACGNDSFFFKTDTGLGFLPASSRLPPRQNKSVMGGSSPRGSAVA